MRHLYSTNMIKIKIQRSTALVSAQHRLHDIGEEFLGAVFETTYRLLHTMGGGRYAALKYDDISLIDSSFPSLQEICLRSSQTEERSAFLARHGTFPPF